MRPSILVVTLAVADLERSLAFYRDGLGLASSGIIATEYHDDVSGADGAIAMFKFSGGLSSACIRGRIWRRMPAS